MKNLAIREDQLKEVEYKLNILKKFENDLGKLKGLNLRFNKKVEERIDLINKDLKEELFLTFINYKDSFDKKTIKYINIIFSKKDNYREVRLTNDYLNFDFTNDFQEVISRLENKKETLEKNINYLKNVERDFLKIKENVEEIKRLLNNNETADSDYYDLESEVENLIKSELKIY